MPPMSLGRGIRKGRWRKEIGSSTFSLPTEKCREKELD